MGFGTVHFVWKSIPKETQQFGKPFLYKLQAFHDCRNNWDKNGLTNTGKEHYGKLKALIELERI